MGEIKSVKVDNWGVFFLQKLQNFFNKTDYCDLTLQFNDNSQLKVHRLVLSACTDYFNVLEQTCEVVDDALIMPNELQADVVVPIVNFMYTGTLEFELKMYGKLLRTAKEMNMTVLLKLLEAHRRTMEGVNRTQCPSSPKTGVRKRGPLSTTTAAAASMTAQVRSVTNSSQVQQQRRVLQTANASATRRVVQTKSIATNVSQPRVQQYRQQVASTSLLKVSPAVSISPQKLPRATYEENKMGNEMGSTIPIYDSSMQFKEEQQDDYDHPPSSTVNQSTSPFEQLRKGYNNNKRPASATFISPPAKKPNIEDVKEFAEQQRMRKQIAAEYGEDQEYESTILDDDIHNDDDDDDTAAAVASSSTTTAAATTTTGALSKSVASAKQQTQPSIIIKQEPNEKPTIVVKDSSNSKMNHAKIISEVLRQYPHLVKSNKSIKLKIMPNIGGQSQKIIVKKEHMENISGEVNIQSAATSTQGTQGQTVLKSGPHQAEQQTLLKPAEKSLPTQQTLSQQKTATAPPTASAANTKLEAAAKSAAVAQPQKRRIDSKTMHALIALGAENTTGPWLCLRCGVNGRPISIPSYRGFRRHLINTHKETIDEALCEHCGWRSTTKRELHFHIHVEHKIKTTLYTFPECLMCAEIFIDTNALNQHMIESHPDENQQQCIYCNKIFAKEIQLFTHMKTYHKKQAIDDGIIDYSEDEDGEGEDDDDCDDDEDEGEAMDTTQEKAVTGDCAEEKQNSSSSSVNNKNKKIKILSDISLPSAGSLMTLESSRENKISSSINPEPSEGLISSTLGSSNTETVEIGKEPKFVSADGNEMVLTDEQRKEIMSQLNQEHEGGVVMVLNESAFADGVEALPNANEETSAEQLTAEQESTDHMEDSSEGQPAADTCANEVEEEEEEEDDEEYNDNNIYGEFAATKNDDVENKESSSSVLDESKGSMENLEWAENLLTAHELEEEEEEHASKTSTKQTEINRPAESPKDQRKNEDISKKLEELTGDWSDDEIDDAIDDAALKPATEYCIREEDLIDKDKEKVRTEKACISDVREEEIAKEESKKAEKMNISTEPDPIDKASEKEPEDDIDMALKSLHKEDIAVKVKGSPSEETTNAIVLMSDEVSDVEMHEDVDQNATDSSKKPLELDESAAIEKQAHQSTTDETASVSKDANEKQNEECAVEKEKDIKALLLKNDDDKGDKEKCKLEQLCPDNDEEREEEKASTSGMQESNAVADTAAEIDRKPLSNIKMEEVTNDPCNTEPATKSKTEETIKTLMSEWADDDDDDDDVETLGTIE